MSEQLTLDQRIKELEREEALERYRYAPKGTKNDRHARAVAATCAALASDPVVKANLLSGVRAR